MKDLWTTLDRNNVEVFHLTHAECEPDTWFIDDDLAPMPGWYYWFSLPGCLPNSAPYGPYRTRLLAAMAAYDDNDLWTCEETRP